jgi:hypothetical protein
MKNWLAAVRSSSRYLVVNNLYNHVAIIRWSNAGSCWVLLTLLKVDPVRPMSMYGQLQTTCILQGMDR